MVFWGHVAREGAEGGSKLRMSIARSAVCGVMMKVLTSSDEPRGSSKKLLPPMAQQIIFAEVARIPSP